MSDTITSPECQLSETGDHHFTQVEGFKADPETCWWCGSPRLKRPVTPTGNGGE